MLAAITTLIAALEGLVDSLVPVITGVGQGLSVNVTTAATMPCANGSLVGYGGVDATFLTGLLNGVVVPISQGLGGIVSALAPVMTEVANTVAAIAGAL